MISTEILDEKYSLSKWKFKERKTIYLLFIIMGFCVLLFLINIIFIWDKYTQQTLTQLPAYGDFFALWSYAKIASMYSPSDLYNLSLLHARQIVLGMAPGGQNPFPYPPTFIFLIWPLSFLPYEFSHILWVAGTMGLFLWAIRATCSRLPLCVFGAIVAPASIATVAAGQSGFLSAALMVAGLRLAGCRPVLGGILIGILTYKPQLGFLIPVALIAAGYWTAFITACATALVLSVFATLAFGWAIWPAWISMMPAYVEMFDLSTVAKNFMPTVLMDLQIAGVSLIVAQGAQVAAALIVAILLWRCFKQNAGRLATAALLIGTFLATPHAFLYDLPMTVAALAIFIDDRSKTASSFSLTEVVVMVFVFMFPALIMIKGFSFPVGIVALGLFFGLLLWHAKLPARAAVHRAA